MEQSSQQPVYQYFTIINSPENENSDETQSSAENQIVYVAFSSSEDENATDSLLDIKEDEETDQNSFNELSSLGSNVKIITLNNGQMFVTTDKAINDGFTTQTILPEDCESSDDEQPLNSSLSLKEDSFRLGQSENYEIVELLDDEQSSAFEMVYCDNLPPESPPEKVIQRPKLFRCLYEGCLKAYATSHQLNVHFRVHLNSKPFACTVEGCNKQFATNYSLKTHVRTHTGEKPYMCMVCEKNFKTSGDLQKHMRTHTGEKPFRCPIEGCGKCFTTSNIRKVHIRSHTGERPYSCSHPNCGKAFSSATNFKNHIRIHSGEKPYVCPVEGCTKRFTEYSSLYKHNMVHQQDRPYACCFCDQRFKQESAMNLHKRVKHNVILANDGTEIVVDLN